MKSEKVTTLLREWLPQLISFILLGTGLLLDYFTCTWFLLPWVNFLWYAVAFLPVGIPVVKEAVEAFAEKDFFNEFTLMLLASVGAFFIGEYPEAVAVMLFYAVGEELQEGAVRRSRRNIRQLLEMRPDRVRVFRNGKLEEAAPEMVSEGETIEVAVGERICIDGVLESGTASVDTSALTGESLPRFVKEGEEIQAGCVVLEQRIRLKTLRPYSDSALAKMARLVEDAAKRKAPTEIFIRRISRIYTPLVILAAVLVAGIPAVVSVFGTYEYDFSLWLYRALVFLVISCPCALVVSIPLSYFAGIGRASRSGILFKGGNSLDAAARIDAVAFDKTGTLTCGKFRVTSIETGAEFDTRQVLSLLASAESASRHPVAQAIVEYMESKGVALLTTQKAEERPGFGIVAKIEGKTVAAGSATLLDAQGVHVPEKWRQGAQTLVLCAIDNVFAAAVQLSDQPKEDAASAIQTLKKQGIRALAVLSGDNPERVKALARELDIENGFGGLLPQDKVAHLQTFKTQGNTVAFVGDGINDSPVLTAADLGVAMGATGSDVAIETADIVLQTDALSRLPQALQLAHRVRKTVYQNIVLAFGIKAVIMILGVFGIATLWGAVFADTGVSLLAVLNSVRMIWGGKK